MNADVTDRNVIRHLYVHFPFCARICPYCAFYKTRGNGTEVERFCEALVREGERVASKFPLKLETIFFGGGTPTALRTEQLHQLLTRFHEIFDLGDLQEWSLEANPGSVSAKKAAILRDGGINRISLGVQSWDDELLRLLGRGMMLRRRKNHFIFFATLDFSTSALI